MRFIRLEGKPHRSRIDDDKTISAVGGIDSQSTQTFNLERDIKARGEAG